MPIEAAVAATVIAWEQRSGDSAPAVTFTTRFLATGPAYCPRAWCAPRQQGGGTRLPAVDGVEIFYTSLLVLVSLLTAWFAGYVVYKLYKGQG